jgi:hypothetical protein
VGQLRWKGVVLTVTGASGFPFRPVDGWVAFGGFGGHSGGIEMGSGDLGGYVGK